MKNPLYRLANIVFLSFGVVSGCNENTVDPVFYGSVQGAVTFLSSGTPAVGVEITTVPTTTTILTDEQGYFSLTEIPTGEYTVVASMEGYKNATNKVVVTKDHIAATDIQLEADASTPNSAIQPTPSSGADNVDRTVTLKWSVDEKNDDPLTFDVVLFESNVAAPILILKDYTDTLINVADLKFNTAYFWQVNVKNSAGTVANGNLWHFKTLPFPDNRFLFSSQRDGNYEIYSSDDSNENLVRLTYSDRDQIYPQYSSDRRFIAYVDNTDLSYHIYVMNRDGSSPVKITSLPVAGFHNDGRGFCWSPDNGKLLYSHYDKLYSIDRDGSNLTLIETAPPGRNFRSCDWTSVGNRIVVETIGILPYENEIRLIDMANATSDVIITNEPGTIQSPSFSVDGKNILFTHDVSGYESATGRQLDSRPFVYNLTSGIRVDISKDKLAGTNDLHPRFAPDGIKVIFENRNNDGSGLPAVYTYDVSKTLRAKLFDNASMPDWQ